MFHQNSIFELNTTVQTISININVIINITINIIKIEVMIINTINISNRIMILSRHDSSIEYRQSVVLRQMSQLPPPNLILQMLF